MTVTTWQQRIKMIHLKFQGHVIASGMHINPTWERFGEYVAIYSGREVIPTKSLVNRWKYGSKLEAKDAVMVADLFNLDLRWVAAGEGEMGDVTFHALPAAWSQIQEDPDGEQNRDGATGKRKK